MVGSGLAADEWLASGFGLHDRGGTLIGNINRDEYCSSSWVRYYRRLTMKPKSRLVAFKADRGIRYKADCRCPAASYPTAVGILMPRAGQQMQGINAKLSNWGEPPPA